MLDFSEAKSYTAILPDEVWSVQYRALVRLLLFFTGRTHETLADFSREANGILTAAGGAGGQLDGLGLYHAVSGVTAAWSQTFKAWHQEFETLRLEAAAIPLGSLCVLHENLVRPWLASIEERRTPIGRELTEASAAATTFDQPIDAVIKAANQRVYEDGLQLSQRVWRLDHDSLNGIKQVIYNGAANGRSAWDMAKDLEQYLGFSQDCPRWTSTRLRLTKKEIAAGDIRGLKSGEACQGQGVAYKALRLARNELQVIHALATDQMMAALPFVEKEQIFLSPSHPEDDECDQVIRDGEGGRGIYPKGTIRLPLHVHCLCNKVAVLLKPDDFTDQLRGWVNGSQLWPAMDQYAGLVGGDVNNSLGGSSVLASLLLWAWGGVDKMKAVVS
jgi:hypothetical protein